MVRFEVYVQKERSIRNQEKMARILLLLSRIVVTGVVAAVAWYVGMILVFGPAQKLLANPEYQSHKFLAVFTQMEPLPRMVVQPVSFYVGFLAVGIAFSLACHIICRWIPGSSFKKGAFFGVIAWLLIIPWFEFYLPWNVMHEPLSLVLLEAGLWFIVLMIVSITAVYTHYFLKSRRAE